MIHVLLTLLGCRRLSHGNGIYVYSNYTRCFNPVELVCNEESQFASSRQIGHGSCFINSAHVMPQLVAGGAASARAHVHVHVPRHTTACGLCNYCCCLQPRDAHVTLPRVDRQMYMRSIRDSRFAGLSNFYT